MSKYRIQGDIVSIKEEKAIELFDTYFDEHCPIESIMLQKGRLDIANDRDNQDYLALSSCIDIYKVKNILDIGCGYGRWLEHFLSSPPPIHSQFKLYDGIDGAENIIHYASLKYKTYYPNIQFHKINLINLSSNTLRPYYDLVIFNGILVYCNDNTLIHILKTLKPAVQKNTIIYLRESVSVIKDVSNIFSNNKRLTLKEYQTDLSNIDYNAIYRTIEEYEIIFKRYFPNLEIIRSGFINTETCKYKETNQHYWILKL